MDARAITFVALCWAFGGAGHPTGPKYVFFSEPEVRSWTREYEGLFGKSYEDVVARLGLPAGSAPGNRIVYARTAARRSMNLGFSNGVVDSIQVAPDRGEELPLSEVAGRPETYYRCYGRTEAISDYMMAWSRDGKTMIQFQYDGRRMRLYRVITMGDSLANGITPGFRPCIGTPESPEIRAAMSRPGDSDPPPAGAPEEEPVRVEAFGEGVLTDLDPGAYTPSAAAFLRTASAISFLWDKSLSAKDLSDTARICTAS